MRVNNFFGDAFMKINVAVIFGCSSVEHEISIISAVQAMHSFDREKYNVIPLYFSKNGEIYTGDNLFDIEKFKNLTTLLASLRKVALVKTDGKAVVKYLDTRRFHKDADIPVDVAFPIVHGTNCEDGSISGYLEVLGLPYVGCDVLSAAIGMDKKVFKDILKSNNIPTLDCISFTRREYSESEDSIIEKLEKEIGYPMIVKPVNLGSSVGISKAENNGELRSAITLSCTFSERTLVEKAVKNLREINCSVVGNADSQEASVLEEPIMHDKILSYDDKYRGENRSKSGGSKGMASLGRKLPADLSPEKTAEIQEIAKRTFKAFGANGVCRIDFLLDTDDNDKVYVNEANTIPGSLSFYLWEASGVKYKDLIDKLISLAFTRERARKNTMFTLDTNILSEKSFGFKGSKGGKA